MSSQYHWEKNMASLQIMITGISDWLSDPLIDWVIHSLTDFFFQPTTFMESVLHVCHKEYKEMDITSHNSENAKVLHHQEVRCLITFYSQKLVMEDIRCYIFFKN